MSVNRLLALLLGLFFAPKFGCSLRTFWTMPNLYGYIFDPQGIGLP